MVKGKIALKAHRSLERFIRQFLSDSNPNEHLLVAFASYWMTLDLLLMFRGLWVTFFESNLYNKELLQEITKKIRGLKSSFILSESPALGNDFRVQRILFYCEPYVPLDVKKVCLEACAKFLPTSGFMSVITTTKPEYRLIRAHLATFCEDVSLLSASSGYRHLKCSQFHPVANPTREKEYEINYETPVKKFIFKSKSGVFAEERVDNGSDLLVRSMKVRHDDIILDAGCGYGLIGIVAASLATNGRAILIDSDTRAITLARKNILLNATKNASAIISNLISSIPPDEFSLVLSNPPQHISRAAARRFWSNIFMATKKGSFGYIVVQKQLPYESLLAEVFSHVSIVSSSPTHKVLKLSK
jgi:16S rRNA (guanine1207-N2)-methyltransferase